jgi:hypothetical protein
VRFGAFFLRDVGIGDGVLAIAGSILRGAAIPGSFTIIMIGIK